MPSILSKLRVRSLSLCLGALLSQTGLAQGLEGVQVNLFSHIEYYNNSEVKPEDYFSLGESALFVTARLPSKWSFLAEGTFRPSKYREDEFTLERYRLRYELNSENWVSVGKMHTPVNYWNDTFHHGRLFFPTINRPLSFNRFIPIHELGVRFGGNGIAGSNFGYDFVLGTGQSEGDDFFEEGVLSYTGTISWSPSNDLRLMASYYRDTILDHANNPGHAHSHSDDYRTDLGMATGMDMSVDSHGLMDMDTMGEDLDYEMFSMSAYWREGDWRSLTEISFNRTDKGEFNESVFQYLGYQWREDWTAYLLFDLVNVADSEIHFMRGREGRYGIGIEYAIGLNASIKTELRRRDDHRAGVDLYSNELQVQLSLGF